MRIPYQVNRSAATFNMTPLIDIVFLLIIFFLVSSHLARREARLPLDLPAAESGVGPEAGQPKLTINISQDGQWRVGSGIATEVTLKSILEKHVDRHGPTASLSIRSDRKVPYSFLSPILKISAVARVPSVAISVYAEKHR
jgi:biopolymer transport protein ExbD